MPRGSKPREQPIGGADSMDGNGVDDGEAMLPILDKEVQAQLGHQLSFYYSSLINQPIPDTFIQLLAKLDKTENAD